MTLLILAAGMGSRFGGLKQMEPMGLMENLLLIIRYMMLRRLVLTKLFL